MDLWIRSEGRSNPIDSKQRGGPQRDIMHGEVWAVKISKGRS